jgi:hypothetical protein
LVILRNIAGILQRFPGALQKNPVLGISNLRLPRRKSEEACIEASLKEFHDGP